MSHQTGISANGELLKFFGTCKDGRIRAFKVAIKDEQLILDEAVETSSTWEDDYDSSLLKLAEERQPAYLFFRLDSKNDTGYEWILISWSPDNSPVRQKMLYASTKATLKKEFGSPQIKTEMFGSTKTDINLRGYLRHANTAKEPAPLTFAEEELLQIKKNESGVEIGFDTKHQTIQGVVFPISQEAISALFDLKDRKINYVQLSIDIAKEEINLESTEGTSVRQLPRRVPNDHARYHLFLFPHSYEGDSFESIVFIYSVPGCNCPIKERMLYSSCKSPLLDSIEKAGIEIAKKIEIDDAKELTEDFLIDEIHPKLNIYKQKFAKPKGPTNRGARRLIKSPKDGGE